MKKVTKITIFIFVLLVIVAGAFYKWNIDKHNPPLPLPAYEEQNTEPVISRENNTQDPIKSSLLLPVPFSPQAPTANWDELHNEACEEASAFMADAYFKGMKEEKLKPDYAETQITKLTEWEKQNFGYHLDTTSAETVEMIEKVYGLKTRLIENFTENDIKQALSNNQLVAISENGQKLGNPNYKQPGPIHHSILVKGYDAKGFITNDSGTRNGLNYRYDFKTLYDAAADWNHDKKTVDESKKIAIIIWK